MAGRAGRRVRLAAAEGLRVQRLAARRRESGEGGVEGPGGARQAGQLVFTRAGNAGERQRERQRDAGKAKPDAVFHVFVPGGFAACDRCTGATLRGTD